MLFYHIIDEGNITMTKCRTKYVIIILKCFFKNYLYFKNYTLKYDKIITLYIIVLN